MKSIPCSVSLDVKTCAIVIGKDGKGIFGNKKVMSKK